MTIRWFLPNVLIAALVCSGCYYYRLNQWTTEDLIAMEHFYRSARANKEYLRVIKSGDPHREFTYDEKEYLRRQITLAASEARQMLYHPETLDKMNPNLRDKYRDEYLRSLELTLRNFDFPDHDVAVASDNLYNSYTQWYEDNLSDIKIPKGR